MKAFRRMTALLCAAVLALQALPTYAGDLFGISGEEIFPEEYVTDGDEEDVVDSIDAEEEMYEEIPEQDPNGQDADLFDDPDAGEELFTVFEDFEDLTEAETEDVEETVTEACEDLTGFETEEVSVVEEEADEESAINETDAFPLQLLDSDAITINYIAGSDRTVSVDFRVKNTSDRTLESVLRAGGTRKHGYEDWTDKRDKRYFQSRYTLIKDTYLELCFNCYGNTDYLEIAPGDTVTLTIECRRDDMADLAPGDYSHFIRLGQIGSFQDDGGGWYWDVEEYYSDDIPINLHVYNPAASLQVLDSNPNALNGNPGQVNSIDFGTIDLSAGGDYILSKDLWYKNISDVTDMITGSVPNISLVSFFFEPLSEEQETTPAFSCGYDNYLWGVERILPPGTATFNGEQDSVIVNAANLLAGTYTAYYHIRTTPKVVTGNNGALANDPESGDIIIPVRVKLTGINANLPERVGNVRATAGNRSVVLTWDALDDFSGYDAYYHIYRRDGEENGMDPDQYDFDRYEQIASVGAGDGITRYVDNTVTNGETYSYFVICTELHHGYPSIAVCATPSDQIVYMPKAPGVSASGTEGGVEISWHLTEDPLFPDYPEGYADGAGVIDHFNVYRNGVLVAQVDQNACRRSPYADQYEWEIMIPCEELSDQNQQITYTWWVTAVATQEMGGAEGYESMHEDAVPYNARPIIEYYEAYWDALESMVSFRVNEDLGLAVLKVWRDGVYLGDNIHNEGNSGYFNNGIEYYDYTAKPGHIYTYQLAAQNSSGVEGEHVTIVVDTRGDDVWITSPYIRYGYNWRIVDDDTVMMEDVYFDPDCKYTVYRNGEVSAVYGKGGTASGMVVYKDTPSQYGTYVYQVMKEENGIRTYSQKFTFIREQQGDELPLLPEAPRLTSRIVGEKGDRKVKLSWIAPSAGGETEGYYVYRTDAGQANTYPWSRGDWQVDYRDTHYGYDEPAQGRYYKLNGSARSYTDEYIFWSDKDEYPHQYWVCAYNKYGVSEPSNIVTYEYEDADNDGYPDEPVNEDVEAPGEPVITGAFMVYDPAYYGTLAYGYTGYLNVTWEKALTGGEVDRYEVFFDRLLDNGEYETHSYSPDVYPGASGSGELKETMLYYFPQAYGSYRVRVVAENSKGTATASKDYFIGGIPSLSVVAAKTPEGSHGASAALTWTGLYQDNEPVTGYEVWRRTAYSLWEKVAELAADVLVWTDSGLVDRETYTYKVIAKTLDPNLPKRASVERSVTVYDGYSAPCTPLLHELQLSGYTGYPYLLLSWDMPSGGVPTGYYLQTKKTTGDEEGEWVDWGSWDNSIHAWIGAWSKAEEKEEYDLQGKISSNEWLPKYNEQYDTFSVRLRAKNSCGYSEWSEPVSVTDILELKEEYIQPEKPACYVTPNAEAGDTSVTLTWEKTSTSGFADAAYYEVYRYLAFVWQGETIYDWQTTYTSYEDGKLIATIPASEVNYSFTDKGLDNGTLYGYEVRACSVGCRYYNSAESYGYYDRNNPYPGFVMVRPEGMTPEEKMAGQFNTMMTALPDADAFRPENEEELDRVSQAAAIYDSMTDKQKKALDPADTDKLASLLQKIEDASDAVVVSALQEQISAVQALMDALPNAEEIDISILQDDAELCALSDQMEEAENALYVLPEAAAKQVDKSKLTALENRLFLLRQTAADQAAVDSVVAKLILLPSPDEIDIGNAGAVQIQAGEARMAYRVLLPRQKSLLSSDPEGSAALAGLVAVEQKISQLQEQIEQKQKEDREAASAVVRLIDALPDEDELTLQAASAVEAARNAYEALTDDQLLLVSASALRKLQSAERKLGYLAEADTVIRRINAFNAETVTTDDEEEIISLREDYEALSDEAKACVPPSVIAQLEALETVLAVRLQEAADQAAADVVVTQIGSLAAVKEVLSGILEDIPESELSGEELEALAELAEDRAVQIARVRAGYTALTAAQKALVSNAAELTEMEVLLGQLMSEIDKHTKSPEELAALQAADQAAADAVIDMIRNLPDLENVSDYDESELEAVIQQAKEAAAEARTAYNELTPVQKTLVTNADDLTAAEQLLGYLQSEAGRQALEEAKQKEKDALAAKDVTDRIMDLPGAAALKLSDAGAVSAARTAYDKLSDRAKTMVDPKVLEKLQNAEEMIRKLTEEANTIKPMTVSGTASYTRMASAGRFALSVNSSVPGAFFTYRSSNTGIAAVDANGYVTPVSAGTAKITVTAAQTGYAVGSMTVTVKVTGLAVGKSGDFGTGAAKASYRVTGADTVMYVKCKASKKSKTLTVPDTVTINGGVYRVTAVGGSAFSGFKKVKKLTVGSNVTSIGAKAFNKCKKLKTLTVRSSKLTAAGCKKALKGSSIKKVKVPKAVKKTYKKKVFVRKICGKKVSVK